MFKNLMICLFFINPVMALAEPRVVSYNRMTFRDFAKLSAILNQCDFKNIEIDKDYILKSSKEEGLKLAKLNNLSSNNIAKEVAQILFDLDEKYPEEIPLPVCLSTLKDFQYHIQKQKVENEIKK